MTLNENTITVTASVTEVTLTATASSKNFSTDVPFKVVDKLYHYTIYYHDFIAAHMSVDAAGVWFWEPNGAPGVEYPFSSKETLSDDNEWLKAESTTLYLVSNKLTAYTELPELVAPRGRYVLVEYNRPANDYDGWNIYSWNTGLGSETELYTELINGKRYITVPIADYEVDLNLAFCMRKTTESDAWAEKDGGDHYITVPADQMVVKAKFVQGKGITEILPYNTGCKLDGANSQIHFYYRDDELFKECKEDSLQKVQLYVNGTTYDMTYDRGTGRI